MWASFPTSREACSAAVPSAILDFGIAKLMYQVEGSMRTPPGAIMGTPAYMSPEQCKGAGLVREPSDIYSLGCILYQMLCGEPPFPVNGVGEVLARHILCAPSPPREKRRALEPAVDELVLRLLAKRPSRRPRAAELKAELDRHQHSIARRDLVGLDTRTAPTLVLFPIRSFDISQQTTLSATSPMASSTGRHRRRAWVPLLFGLLIALSGVSFALGAQDCRAEPGSAKAAAAVEPSAPETAETPARSAPASARPTAVSSASPAPATAPPAAVKIVIESKPGRVSVYREAGRARVGRTPYEFETPPAGGTLRFLLRKTGYRDLAVEIPTTESRTYSFDLTRSSDERRVPPATEPSVSASQTTAQKGDGLEDTLPIKEVLAPN